MSVNPKMTNEERYEQGLQTLLTILPNSIRLSDI
jgi:hypothetical protein